MIRRASVEARMRSLAVVEIQIPTDRSACLADAVVGPEIDLFVFDRAPEPLDEDIVTPGAPAVHAYGDGVVEQQPREVETGELAALVRVENVGLGMLRRGLSNRLDAEADLHRDRDPPG